MDMEFLSCIIYYISNKELKSIIYIALTLQIKCVSGVQHVLVLDTDICGYFQSLISLNYYLVSVSVLMPVKASIVSSYIV